MITQKYLEILFGYNGKDLVWKESRGLAVKGSVAGTINSRGYRHIRIDNNFYQAHRLIWIFFNGAIPEDCVIDHMNRDRSDNRIENLRVLSVSENNRNSAKSDHANVGVWKTGKRFKATYRVDGKRYYIGIFDTEDEAIAERRKFIESIA